MLYGFDIGGTKIEIVVFDESLTPLWHKRIATPLTSYTAFLTSLIELIREADEKFSVQGRVGIGIPGLVNHHTGTVYSTNIAILHDKPFIRDFEHAIARSVFINNDANCFVLSEAFDDDFKSYQSVLGIILGTGVGGGIVVNQQIISGANGCAGEVGHIRLPIDVFDILGKDIPLLKCGCGLVGCCEQYLSGRGFEWLYTHFYHYTLDAPSIIERYYQGDKSAKQHVDRYLELLSAYLAHLIMIIDADLIVFGGGLSHFEAIYQHVPTRMSKYLLKQMVVPRLAKARYGDAGGARGAALLCLNQNNE
ncbi:N-acetylglucosamine kinase [Orbus hercynius]|uniref:N-acetylglucosamine kinase n=1 Tax=Orbus hercynius TaxID=593135 RepID=A0A495RHW5_9GAMM|nr:N-acetylglucosamine kinase [Orbus hercynius]RKS87092.1 N-acetylglucosamine kinase [Orbus hercynius]